MGLGIHGKRDDKRKKVRHLKFLQSENISDDNEGRGQDIHI